MLRENVQPSQTRDEAVSLPRLPAVDLAHIVQHGEAEWRALCGQRFLITGGTGFFGIWLLEAIAAANQTLGAEIQVWVLSRDPQSFLQRAPHLASSEFHWLTGDVRDFDFPRGQFDNIVHAATPASAVLNDTDPRTMFDTIVQGTERTLEFALASGCKRFLLTSSGAVYGQQPTDMPKLAETFNGGPDCSSPGSAYAEGKRAAELLCAIAAREHALEIKIARCFAFVGPHLPLNAHFAIGNFLRDALQDRPITVESDGSPLRSYLYAADLVIWLLAILVRGKSGRAYNVGSDASISIGKLAELVAAEQEVACAVHIKQKPRENTLPTRYVPDITRARNDLGVDVRIGLQDAIRRTLAWNKTSSCESLAKRPCPVCGGLLYRGLHHMKFSLPDNSPLPPEYDIVACAKCGSVHADTPGKQEDYDVYYTRFSRYKDPAVATGGGDTVADAARIEITADRVTAILESIGPSARILDVGCARGGLLMALRRRGFLSIHGFDPSAECMNHLAKSGVRATTGLLSDPSALAGTGPFDLIILSHVMEHVVNVRGALQFLRSLLSDGGQIYIEVPDASRYLEYPFVPFYYFDSEHINHFCSETLATLAAHTGFVFGASGEADVRLPNGAIYPATWALFRRGTRTLLHSCSSLPEKIVAYTEQSKAAANYAALHELAQSGRPVLLWGAGSHAQRLLRDSPLQYCKLVGVVDKDCGKQGLTFAGHIVQAPESILETLPSEAVIIIAAALHADAIAAHLHSLGVGNENVRV